MENNIEEELKKMKEERKRESHVELLWFIRKNISTKNCKLILSNTDIFFEYIKQVISEREKFVEGKL
jgi:hypothetical protein